MQDQTAKIKAIEAKLEREKARLAHQKQALAAVYDHPLVAVWQISISISSPSPGGDQFGVSPALRSEHETLYLCHEDVRDQQMLAAAAYLAALENIPVEIDKLPKPALMREGSKSVELIVQKRMHPDDPKHFPETTWKVTAHPYQLLDTKAGA